jgi:hypothetical protein
VQRDQAPQVSIRGPCFNTFFVHWLCPAGQAAAQADPRPCAGCEAGRRLRSQSNPGCCRRPARAAAVSLPPLRQPCYDWTAGSGRGLRRNPGMRGSGMVLWGAAHIAFLIGPCNRITVLTSWLWAYLTFRRGSRLITGSGLSTPAPSLTTPGGYSKQRSASLCGRFWSDGAPVCSISSFHDGC